MDRVLAAIRKSTAFREALASLGGGGETRLGGMWGSSAALVSAALTEETAATMLLVVGGVDEAEQTLEDLEAMCPGVARLFPAWETLIDDEEPPDPAIAGRRLTVLAELAERRRVKSDAARIFVTPVQALIEAVAAPDVLGANRLTLTVGDERDPDEIAAWLVERGFEPSPWVDRPGEFSRRGGIFDVYPADRARACRIEFSGDTIESIRLIDPETQRSDEEVASVEFVAAGGAALRDAERAGTSVSLLAHLPADAVVAIVEPVNVQERARAYLDGLGDPRGTFGWDALMKHASAFRRLTLEAFAGEGAVEFKVQMPEAFAPGLENAVQGLAELACDVDRLVVFCNNEAEARRLTEAVPAENREILGRIVVRFGRLNHGFKLPDERMALVGHQEIFHRYTVRRPTVKALRGRPLESFIDLSKGDLVVHVNQGIGRYLGTERLDRDGTEQEFLVIEFRDHVKVYVPSTRINLVQKYVGGFEGRPRLSLVGGAAWQKKKEQVAKAVGELAAEMLRMQALRGARSGIAFPPDDNWQREFEAEFLYEETEDQLTVLEEIKRDMTSTRPMDRLICGDVGYGKTELAMRAAFKAAIDGKQVAVLVPTTVLAQQHHTTFRERMADYPIEIDVISRFRTRAEQRRILDNLAAGRIDILIGTHRIVQNDVLFRDLGLVIIDEEQRFGVMHKEHFKRLRATVDVLTLTATPIPRTLHMSLLGIRDISALETPPQDRQAIDTHVFRFDRRRVREAVLRELNRDGQVFFVHNRVHNIHRIAAELADIAPEATLAVAHGQMGERELSRHMASFVRGDVDVLVSTTIIESGLDIPNANTIFVNNADHFGLADLHQLRGRVGRYKHRAHAYFMIDPKRRVTPKAAKRLKAIEEYAELGAGFRIALRDLEIRGAGNILGPEQSGHIAAVGYDLYCQLLEGAVLELRGEPTAERPETTVHIGLAAYLPDGYVPEESDRINIYRRLERACNVSDFATLRDELSDRFGKPPEPVEALFVLHEVRLLLERHEVAAVTLLRGRLVFTFRNAGKLLQLTSPMQSRVRVIDDETAHLILPEGVHDADDVVALLRHLFGAD